GQPAGTANFVAPWNPPKDAGGPGSHHVTLYVATDGGAYKIWQKQLTTASGTLVYEGESGHTYQFLALASDIAGNRERPGAGVRAEDDGSHVNLGAPATVPDTTPPNFGQAPPPKTQPSTSPLFTQAERLIPSAASPAHAAEYTQVLAPFVASAFARGIETSNAGIGPMAIAEAPDGTFLVSG